VSEEYGDGGGIVTIPGVEVVSCNLKIHCFWGLSAEISI
jgi:hypothetical protein